MDIKRQENQDGVILFNDDNGRVVEFNLVKRTVQIYRPIKEAAAHFWMQIMRLHKETPGVINLIYEEQEIIHVDPDLKQIVHELWDPGSAFLMTEFERFGHNIRD